MPYKGKHRGVGRSRRTAKKVGTTAALTGAAVIVPAIGLTSPAHAATVDTWTKLAQCESSGDWSINTGNSFYGGLQFTASTWREFGGTQYAARADLATKAQQIATAEKVLSEQGWGAWPTCSAKLGLGEADKAGDAGAAPAIAKTTKVADTGKATAPKGAPARKLAPGTAYTVAAGDTLAKIATAHQVDGGWQGLWKVNHAVIGSDPNLILPDQKLRLEGAATATKAAPKAKSAPASTKAAPAKATTAKGWVLPLESYHLTARFAQSGSHWGSSHHGLDFAAPTGTPIHAVGAGEIIAAGWDGAYGNRIEVRHADGTVTLYGHMSRFARTSGSVDAGTVIGYVGATGNATGPHVHLEVRPHGGGLDDSVDPFTWLTAKGLKP
ncbi:transglycosylase family protein [Actinopolymorpha pittospori]|uniref:Murein DD-endopeptidase MepM/ murein hydrolase activator NlpD n=1 Tax=Actinopolymorpha pittospori TaxID=648752 RepID=A0A927MZQ4_9ACTN|nr:transglycosylase family protein [Actinopolymorpha pittospori]MBE1609329.1 murein DD-endopeptidase MepM/ murein hydrolase activator NlpD [Actinopolymorpha pittospori]